MLEEEDLHFRSHLSGTLLTVEPICLHQGIATLFSSRIFQKSCGRRIRTSDLKVMSLASYLCYHPTIYYKLKETCDNICRGYQFHHSIYMEIGLEPIHAHSRSKSPNIISVLLYVSLLFYFNVAKIWKIFLIPKSF